MGRIVYLTRERLVLCSCDWMRVEKGWAIDLARQIN
jgi:hypothetical protein